MAHRDLTGSCESISERRSGTCRTAFLTNCAIFSGTRGGGEIGVTINTGKEKIISQFYLHNHYLSPPSF